MGGWLEEGGVQDSDKCGQGANAPRGRRTLRTVETLAFHGDIMRKSVGKAGSPGQRGWLSGGVLEVEGFMSLPQRPAGISECAKAYGESIAESPACSLPASIK